MYLEKNEAEDRETGLWTRPEKNDELNTEKGEKVI